MKIEPLHPHTYTPIYVSVHEGTVLKGSAKERKLYCVKRRKKKRHEL